MENTTAAPPAPTPAPRPMRRWGIGLNVFFQIVLVLCLFGFANYLSYRHFIRRDLTPSHDFSLSDTTIKYMHKLDTDVDIAIVFSRESNVMPDIRSLVEGYRSAKKSRIHVEEVDPARDLERAEQLKLKNDVLFKTNGILVRANNKSRFISEEEIVIKGMTGDRVNPSVDFRGEDALTSTIINLIEGKVKKIYFIVGQGEASGKGLGAAYQALTDLGKGENFRVAPLNLTDVDQVPEDANGIILVGIKYDFSDRELGLLKSYWDNKRAALLVLLEPNAETPHLQSFLESNGVFPRNDRVLYAESTSAGPKKEFGVETVFTPDSHISRSFVETSSKLSGQTQSLDLRIDSPQFNALSIEIVPLATASSRYWGETHYLQELPVIGPDDTPPPVYIAASVERGPNDPRLRVDSARMVVVGNATMLDPSTRQAVHQDFMGASLNWLIHRENLMGITPKSKRIFRLHLTSVQHQRIYMVTAVLMPLVVLMLGMLVWNHRRA